MNSRGLFRAVSVLLIATSVSLFSVTHTSAQPRFSVNALSHVDVTFYAGSNLVANPLNAGDNTVGNIFKGIPDGSYFMRWHSGLHYFDQTNRYSINNGWSDPQMTLVAPEGGCLWLPRTATM